MPLTSDLRACAADGRSKAEGAAVTENSTGRPVRGREALPALASDPILERLDHAPDPAPKAGETPHDRVRRDIIAADGDWIVLHTRTALTEAAARRLARSYSRAKPARLDPTAHGRFLGRPFQRDRTWLVAVAYQPPDPSTR